MSLKMAADRLAKRIRGGNPPATGGGAPPVRFTRGVLEHVGTAGSCTVKIDGGTVALPATKVGTGAVGDTVEVVVIGERTLVLGKPR